MHTVYFLFKRSISIIYFVFFKDEHRVHENVEHSGKEMILCNILEVGIGEPCLRHSPLSVEHPNIAVGALTLAQLLSSSSNPVLGVQDDKMDPQAFLFLENKASNHVGYDL